MNCDSVNLISSPPFPYHREGYYRYNGNILNAYIRAYRKELTPEILTLFLISESDKYFSMDDRLKYIKTIYKLDKLSFDLNPNQIERIFNKCGEGYKKNIEFIYSINNDNTIFEGDDLRNDKGRIIINPLQCRSFKIFQAIY